MNIAELQKKLIAAARADAPSDVVPYAFEKRVTALLAARTTRVNLVVWARGLWRAAVPCMAIALLLGVLTLVRPATSGNATDFSQNFENTLLAAVDQSAQTE